MSIALTVKLSGDKKILRVLSAINPETNPSFVREALVAGGLVIQNNAALKQIKRGGILKSGRHSKALGNKLTSRSGVGRGSISVNREGLHRFFVDIGSHGAGSAYMRLHETGGRVLKNPHLRQAHKRQAYTRKGGVSVKAHNVRATAVTAFQVTYPPRPYMAPAMAATQKEVRDTFTRRWARELNKR